jgi:ribosomal-protein-alanine N-acetyltransferase
MGFKLKLWTYDDLESVFYNANNPDIYKFMSDEFPDSIEKWKSFIDYTLNDKTVLYLAIKINENAVGGIGITPQKGIKRKNAELGYWLGKNYWGQGIMSKAVKEIVKLAFEKFEINRIYATPFETNTASHKVLERSGFILETRFVKTVIKNGILLDELVYAIRK